MQPSYKNLNWSIINLAYNDGQKEVYTTKYYTIQ